MQELCCYIRKSVLRAGKPSDSPEIQRAAIEQWNRIHGPYHLVWFEDLDQTGLTENRPDWQRLLRYLPQTAGVIVYNYTKTHRNVKDYLAFYDTHIAPFGKILVDATNPMLDLRTSDGRLMATMFMAVAEHHARKTSDLMKDKVRYTVDQKHRHWGRNPFACDRDETTKHLVPTKKYYYYNPVTDIAIKANKKLPPGWEIRYYSDALRCIYDLYSTGTSSLFDTATVANSGGWRHWSHGGWPVKFNRQSVYKILRSWRLYAGELPPGYQSRGKRPIVAGGHDPILPVELCYRVGEVMEKRHVVRVAEKVQNSTYLLSGILRCGHCQQRLTGQRMLQQYQYYRHSDTKTDDCPETMIRCEQVDKQITEMLMELVEIREFIEAVAGKIQRAIALTMSGDEVISLLRAKQEQLERLIDLHISGHLPKDQFVTRSEPVKNEISRLEKKIASQGPALYLEEHVRRMMSDLARLSQATAREKRVIILTLISKMFIRNKQIVEVIPTAEATPLFSVCKVLPSVQFKLQ